MVSLENLGYNPFIAQHARQFTAKGLAIERITEEHRGHYIIRNDQFEIPAEVAGRLMYHTETRIDYPAIGDWVVATTYDENTRAVIQAVVTRRTILTRKAPTRRTKSQVVATNVDYIFILQTLDRESNPRELERYLVVARGSEAVPIILLSKKDLCPPEIIQSILDEAKTLVSNVPVMA